MVSTTTPNLSKEETIQIFPNPTTGLVYWSPIHEETRICVYDLMGKIILEQEDKNSVVDLGKFPDGLYFITLFSPDGHRLTSKAVMLAKK